MEDFGKTLIEQLEADVVRPADLSSYSAILITFDIGINLLKSLFSEKTRASSPIFILLTGGSSSLDHCLNLRREFDFDIVVDRPIKRSLFVAQLNGLLNQESEAISKLEQSENNLSERLINNYIKALEQRFKALRDVIIESCDTNIQGTSVEEAKRLVHNMRGTAGSLGLIALATHAKAIEENLSSSELRPEKLKPLLADLLKEIMRLEKSHQLASRNEIQTFSKANVLAFLKEPLDIVEVEILTKSNINVSMTCSEIQFYADLADPRLDSVIMELRSPLGKPAGLVKQLRAMSGRSDLPIGIIQKADSNDKNESAYAHAGISYVLTSPVDANNLVHAANYLVQTTLGGRPKILIVDDDEDFTSIVASILNAEGILVKTSNSPFSVETLLQDFNADLLIVDVNMPGQSGVELCRRLRSQRRWSDFPILFLTAEHDVDTRVRAYEAGADDYLSKPLIVPELLARVKGRLERLKLHNERFEKDVLTGVLLRRSFLERFEDLLHHANRIHSNCSLAVIDVDHFKAINDKYGHLVGDEILSSLGQQLLQRFRVGDLRGRWGGEEFVIALPHTSAATAKGAVERMLDEIRSIEYKSSDGRPFMVSFSGGVAASPTDGESFHELFLKADSRLYIAKESGRSNICDSDKT